ncbi:TPA: hypothetical protein N0F65_005135 [Lagenidium giganteum]|uniref:Cyclin-like domain-containing protein n=1 Tax=Lagenidium giganteum TaxID=4803 RepID=A0AAV2YXS0_9STRA|nr:TPA: hypothetical protein N0F65_005135 [Lagenidium giganteum]
MDGKENEERGRAIVQTLAAVVESMVHSSDSIPMAYYQKTKFEAFRSPGISIRDYLLRIHKYASCSPECFVLALVYIDRLHQMHGFVLTDLNVHRVVISSVVLAAKFFDDHYFNNAYYAKVGGVPCSEMNELEVEFLLLINFSLHVCTDTYTRYYNELANHYIFTSVRNSTLPVPSYNQLRHYVTEDPERAGQLVYVTDVSEPEDDQLRKRVDAGRDPHGLVTAGVAAHRQHGGYHHQHPAHTQMHQHQHFFENTTRTHGRSGTNGIVCTNSTRSTGQKRRSAVALGVNA